MPELLRWLTSAFDRDEFVKFNDNFVNHAEKYLKDKLGALIEALKGTGATAVERSANQKSLEVILSVENPKTLGRIVACYAFGKLASDVKENLFSDIFHCQLVCPEEYKVGDTMHILQPDEQKKLTKLLQLLFRILLRVQVQLEWKDLVECLESVKDSELKVVISISRLCIPEQVSEGQPVVDALLECLDANTEVKDAALLSYAKLESAQYISHANKVKMHIPHIKVSSSLTDTSNDHIWKQFELSSEFESIDAKDILIVYMEE